MGTTTNDRKPQPGVPTGYVAVQPKGPYPIKLHLMREDQTGTVCRLYPVDRILPEDYSGVDQNTPVCRTCLITKSR